MKREETNSYVADVFRNRLKVLGISMYKFLNTAAAEYANKPTLARILRGVGNTQFDTVVRYAEWLGLEVVIRPKETIPMTLERLNIREKIRGRKKKQLDETRDKKWKSK